MKKRNVSVTNFIDSDTLQKITAKNSDSSYWDKFKRTLTDEEKKTPSFLDWSDERVGEMIHVIFMTLISSFEMMTEAAYKSSTVLAHTMFKQKKDKLEIACCFDPTTSDNKHHYFTFSIEKKLNFSFDKPLPNQQQGSSTNPSTQQQSQQTPTKNNFNQNTAPTQGLETGIEENEQSIQSNMEGHASKEFKLTGILSQQYMTVGQLAQQINKIMAFDDAKGKEACYFTAMILVLMQNCITRNAQKSESTLSGLTLKDKLVTDAAYIVNIQHELKQVLACHSKYTM